jgi:hypothetical protein
MLSHTLSGHIFYAQLFAHFQLQYAVVLASAVILLVFLRQYVLAAITSAYIILISVFFLYPVEVAPQEPTQVDIFFMNVYGKNNVDMEPMIASISLYKPPVVALVEANDDIIDPLTEMYGKPVISEKSGYFHCAVFTEQEVFRTESVQGLHTPVCLVEFSSYTLLVIHTHSPLIPSAWEKNRGDLIAIGEILDKLSATEKSFLVVGDFNSSNYSYPFRSSIGSYVQKNIYTWEANRPVMLPLDYALSDMDMTYHRLPKMTSDHAGLLVDLPF